MLYGLTCSGIQTIRKYDSKSRLSIAKSGFTSAAFRRKLRSIHKMIVQGGHHER
jgi:hypothetical protein